MTHQTRSHLISIGARSINYSTPLNHSKIMEPVMACALTSTSSLSRVLGTTSIVALMFAGAGLAAAADFVDPPVFASQNGVLDILMVAKAKPIPTISFRPPHSQNSINPTGWVYEICKRPSSGLTCPSGFGTASPYGGLRRPL